VERCIKLAGFGDVAILVGGFAVVLKDEGKSLT
jgi:hypothetical protein